MELFASIDFANILMQNQYTGLIVFLIAFLETLLLVGFFFPGSMALLAIGGLITTGHLSLWPTLFWAFLGAVIGDNISFWIGVYFQKPLKRSRIYKKHCNAFKKGEIFFHQYGAFSVVFGRFIGPIRAVIPTIAGSMGMSGTLFFFVNIFSALLWAPAYILPGMIFGDIYIFIEKHIKLNYLHLILILIAIFMILLLIPRSKQNTKRIIPFILIACLLVFAFIFIELTQTIPLR